jgi:hypothetical protein
MHPAWLLCVDVQASSVHGGSSACMHQRNPRGSSCCLPYTWHLTSILIRIGCACRYGTVPVAHRTGGLKDTVIDFNPWKQEGTGWTYTQCDAEVGATRGVKCEVGRVRQETSVEEEGQ